MKILPVNKIPHLSLLVDANNSLIEATLAWQIAWKFVKCENIFKNLHEIQLMTITQTTTFKRVIQAVSCQSFHEICIKSKNASSCLSFQGGDVI